LSLLDQAVNKVAAFCFQAAEIRAELPSLAIDTITVNGRPVCHILQQGWSPGWFYAKPVRFLYGN
jgi:hypothetical protein